MPNPNATPSATSTAKLVFLWKNDNSDGTQPGAILYNVSVAGIATPCDAPTNLEQVIALKVEGSIHLTWIDHAGVSEWDLQYRPLNGDWVTVVVTGEPTYTITGLENGDVYEVLVQAVCGDGVVSEWSSILTATATNSGIENWSENRVTLYPNTLTFVLTAT